MQHFLEGVNDGRTVPFLRDESGKELAQLVGWGITDRDVDERGEDAVRVDAEHALERRLGIDMERMDVLESVERLAADYALIGDHELELTRVAGDEEIANDADQDKGDRHDRAVGKDGVGDDEREEDSRDHQSTRVGPDMDVFRCTPRQDGVANEDRIHRLFFVFSTIACLP